MWYKGVTLDSVNEIKREYKVLKLIVDKLEKESVLEGVYYISIGEGEWDVSTRNIHTLVDVGYIADEIVYEHMPENYKTIDVEFDQFTLTVHGPKAFSFIYENRTPNAEVPF